MTVLRIVSEANGCRMEMELIDWNELEFDRGA